MNLTTDKLCEAETNRIARDIGKSVILAGDFNTCLSEMDRSSGRKSVKTVKRNNNIHQLDIIHICKLWQQQNTHYP